MFKKILKKLKGDKADSSVISLVILIPLIVGLLLSIIDVSAYFANRSVVQGMAQNGARTVSIMGGNGTGTTSTPIEAKYGLSKDLTCNKVLRDGIAGAALISSSTAIECNIMIGFQETAGLINVEVSSVKCSPSKAEAIGQRTSCEIRWTYGGTPGSGLTFFGFGDENTTSGSAESEVNLKDVGQVGRR